MLGRGGTMQCARMRCVAGESGRCAGLRGDGWGTGSRLGSRGRKQHGASASAARPAQQAFVQHVPHPPARPPAPAPASPPAPSPALGSFRESPVLPFNAYGTLAIAREEFDANSGSSQFFWLLKVGAGGRCGWVVVLPQRQIGGRLGRARCESAMQRRLCWQPHVGSPCAPPCLETAHHACPLRCAARHQRSTHLPRGRPPPRPLPPPLPLPLSRSLS